MNRNILVLLAFLSLQAYGDCIARTHLEGEDPPLYQIKSCVAASEVVDTKSIDKFFNQPTKSDKAVLIVPENQSAENIIRGNSEYWHYSGSCNDLPLQKIVSLKTEAHCSDLGTTFYSLLGDISIKAAIEY